MKPTYHTNYPLPRRVWLKVFQGKGAMSRSEIVHKIAALRRLQRQDRVPEYTVMKWLDMAVRDGVLKKDKGIQGKYILLPLNAGKEQTLNFDSPDEQL